ncbi:hypothetical protein EGT29_14030 [Pigmentiphaga sp. H8]|uniref:hypothetical protein n=1 Tax=Pigmentiphaga sp. H8 TaxID=2488560 RepID=UPI000F5A42BC|nr:hypothetical protein [Pigmentiphaga sp. H8]AZG08888.1 hypothetical protein EGT29_14030 [Pigmentiphaga sp. H8]
MTERLLVVLILCAAVAAPFCLVWLNARALQTDFSVIHPLHAAGPKGGLATGEWYDAARSSCLQS